MVKRRIRVGDADRAVLGHVAKHGMTTKAVLPLDPLVDIPTVDAAKKRLQRLRTAGFLDSAILYENRYYFHLTKKGARFTGETVRDQMHLSDDAKVRAYAGLIFCTDPQTKCQKQSAAEFKQRFAMLWKPGMRLDYYLNISDPQKVRLGYYRVDYSPGSRRWREFIATTKTFIKKRSDNPTFREMIFNGQFEITIITALQDKADGLKQAFEEEDLPPNMPLRFYVIEDLLPLIAPQPF